jgi:thiamine-phosphate pyrophosphorylase
MNLLLVSPFVDVPDEQYVLNLLFCEGLTTFHLRKANYSTRQMMACIEQIPAVFRSRVVLHSHFELIGEYGLRGAHFTRKYTYADLLRDHRPALRADGRAFAHQSFSLHSLPEIRRTDPVYDYLFLSPVFDSISNQGYNSRFRMHDLQRFLHAPAPRPAVIALGGITDAVVGAVFESGFDGMALLGHIWTRFGQDQDIVGAVTRFRHVQHLIRQRESQPLIAAPTAILNGQ